MATRNGRLTKNDIKTVRKEVLPAAAKYYDLGIELGLDPDYLNTLTSKSDEESLRELLVRWLSGVDPEPTWEALCEALRNPAIKHELLAEEIEEKYCKLESGDAPKDSANGEAVKALKQSTIIEQDEEKMVDLTASILSERGVQMVDSTPAVDNTAPSRRQNFTRPKRVNLVISTPKFPLEVCWVTTYIKSMEYSFPTPQFLCP